MWLASLNCALKHRSRDQSIKVIKTWSEKLKWYFEIKKESGWKKTQWSYIMLLT